MQFLAIEVVIDLHKLLIDSAITHPQMLRMLELEQNIYVLAAAYCYHSFKIIPP
jgi:hypothetical protein